MQINNALRNLIKTKGYEPGDKFLTEREVCRRYSVSRATANKALSNLVSEKVLEFRKGVGTFVKNVIFDYDLRSLTSFNTKVSESSKVPHTILFKLEERKVAEEGPEICNILKCGPDERVFYLKRLRLADDTPLILERRYIPNKFCPALTKEDAEGSIYAVLREKFHHSITGADEVMKAIIIPPEDAAILQCRQGSAGFLMLVTGFTEEQVPLWYSEVLYRGDLYEFHNRVRNEDDGFHHHGVLKDTDE